MNKWMLVTAMWLLSDGLQGAAEFAPEKWAAYSPRPVPSATLTEGTLSFDGRATIGDFTGTTATVHGEMTGGDKLSERDKDLNKSMESDKYPTMRFELTGVTPTAEQGDTVLVDLQGKFWIHGVEREVAIRGAAVALAAGAIRIVGATPMNLKDYRIGGLTKGWGMLRMYEQIVVHFDVTFTPGRVASPTAAEVLKLQPS